MVARLAHLFLATQLDKSKSVHSKDHARPVGSVPEWVGRVDSRRELNPTNLTHVAIGIFGRLLTYSGTAPAPIF